MSKVELILHAISDLVILVAAWALGGWAAGILAWGILLRLNLAVDVAELRRKRGGA